MKDDLKRNYLNFKTITLAIIVILSISYFIGRLFVVETSLTQKEKEWLAANAPLSYVADRNAPPLRFIDEGDGQYKGILIDYLNALSVEIGSNIELYPMLWEEVIETLSRGEADISDMFTSPERSRYFEFSDPIYNLRAVLTVSADNSDINSLSQLIGKRLGVQKGDYASEYVTVNFPGIKQVFTADVEEAILLLDAGIVDAVIGDEPVVFYNINKKDMVNRLRVIEKPVYENQVVFAVNKQKPELVSILNKGIKTLRKKAVLEKIQQKWFGISAPIVTQENIDDLKRAAVATTFVGALVLIGMWFWNNSLKQLIDQRTKELEDSRDELQKVFDGMNEYMVVLDESKRIVNINASLLDHLSDEKENLIGSTLDCAIKFTHGMDIENQVEETLRDNRWTDREVTLGSHAFRIKTYPLGEMSDKNGKALVLIHDITAEKISENKLLQSNKMVAIGELAAGVAHEIRNPLGIIRNHSYIMRNSTDSSGISRSLDYIDSAVKRASRIIDNLLNFSRMSGDSIERVKMRTFIENVIELQGKNLDKLGIKVHIECYDDLQIEINLESLKHIFINLISNAVDAMKNGGQIYIQAIIEGSMIALNVSDTGHGIERDDLARIFNPFYTTKEPGVGTGLGLYIVYNEVEKLGGSIDVISEPGKGTSFMIKIPLGEV